VFCTYGDIMISYIGRRDEASSQNFQTIRKGDATLFDDFVYNGANGAADAKFDVYNLLPC